MGHITSVEQLFDPPNLVLIHKKLRAPRANCYKKLRLVFQVKKVSLYVKHVSLGLGWIIKMCCPGAEQRLIV
jgi:hypothetical protein